MTQIKRLSFCYLEVFPNDLILEVRSASLTVLSANSNKMQEEKP